MRKLIIIGLILLVFISGGYYLLSRPDESPSSPSEMMPAKAAALESTTINGLSEVLQIKPEIRDYNYMDWISETDDTLPLNGKQFLVGTMNINGIGKYAGFSGDDLTNINLKTLAPLITTADTYFVQKGFTKNAKNTIRVGKDTVSSSFIGYEKNDLKCKIRIDEQSDPFGNFVCGVIDTAQLERQKQFVTLFYKTDYYGDAITSFRVDKLEDNYAMGTANGVYSGFTWMAKKTDNSWAVVWRGQEIPLCTEMMKYTIPQSLYGSCYSENEAQ